MRYINPKVIGLVLGASLFTSFSAQAVPTFDVFGPLPEATFGGAGIPNDAVAISRLVTDTYTLTLGLSATQRFSNPPLTNDGAGTFTATPGFVNGGSRWNFDFFVGVEGDVTLGELAAEGYRFVLRYDFDPSSLTDFGTLDLTPFAASGSIEDSQNMTFGFLAGVPALAFVTPPAGSFDADTPGLYSFELSAINDQQQSSVLTAIDVNVVPEPATLGLFGLGLGLLALRRRRR